VNIFNIFGSGLSGLGYSYGNAKFQKLNNKQITSSFFLFLEFKFDLGFELCGLTLNFKLCASTVQ
jgi:hypothetical protein